MFSMKRKLTESAIYGVYMALFMWGILTLLGPGSMSDGHYTVYLFTVGWMAALGYYSGMGAKR